MRRRSIRWWLLVLVLVLAGCTAVAGGIGLLLFFGYFFLPDMDDLGPHPMDGDAAVRAMRLRKVVNPDFPAPRRASCTDEIVATSYPGLPWFSCSDGIRVAVTTRTVGGDDVSTDHYFGTPPDAETLLVADTGAGVELYALSAGH